MRHCWFCKIVNLPESSPPGIPQNPGSSLKRSMIRREVSVTGGGGFPPPVLCRSCLAPEKSFFAVEIIARHLSFTSPGVLFAAPIAFILSQIDCHTAVFFWLVSTFENFSRITCRFWSAISNSKFCSAGEKLGFLGRLAFSPDLLRNFG